MAKVILGMSMSLDGYINDKNGSVDKLYPDFEELHHTKLLQDAIKNTGAVIMGKHAYEMAENPDWYADNYEFQTAIFVVTHSIRQQHPKETNKLKFIFVNDGIKSAVLQAKKAAGSKDVQIIGGASTFQQCLNSGLCDELQIDIISVLLGSGTKLFDNLDINKIQLEKVSVEDSTPQRASLIFKIIK